MNAKFFPALGWVLVATFTLRGVSTAIKWWWNPRPRRT